MKLLRFIPEGAIILVIYIQFLIDDNVMNDEIEKKINIIQNLIEMQKLLMRD